MNILENSIEFEKRLLSSNNLTYRDYLEIKLISDIELPKCYKCNSELQPLTQLDRSFYQLPCWDCVNNDSRGVDKSVVVGGILKAIKDFYMNRVLGDYYFQLFIVDPIYFSNTLPHGFSEFKKVINSISLPDRKDLWFLDWKPGYPKIISMKNLSGIKTVNLNKVYENSCEITKDYIRIKDYKIYPPEIVQFDPKHYSRYNIYNSSIVGNNKSKRLRIGDNCIKFYNTPDSNIKSIFRVMHKNSECSIKSISYQDYALMKLLIMRSRPFLKIVFDILTELSRNTGTLNDTVFLRNEIKINPDRKDKVSVYWSSFFTDSIETSKSNTINISII